MKKTNGATEEIKPLKMGKEDPSSLLKVNPLPNWKDLLPQSLEMLRHISVEEKKVYPLNPFRYNLARSPPKLFPPSSQL